jgi:hypothetical protein
MRGILSLSAATVFAGALFVAGEAAADIIIPGVPVSEAPPLFCKTADFTIEAITGPNFQFPKPATCGGSPCSDYGYKITSTTLNIDHTLFALSATQNLYLTSPTATVIPPGHGDHWDSDESEFLESALHEYAVRFNSNYTKSVEAHILIRPLTLTEQSKARIGTVLVKSGKKREACLIATPGVEVAPDTFQPTFSSQTALVAGGKCTAHLFFDANGNLSDVTTDSPCVTNDNPDADVIVNGKPLKNNTSPFGITFGDGTSTCYGPPVPSRPKCICTAAPCP